MNAVSKHLTTAPSGNTATPQAQTRHHFSVAQPALPPPVLHMQPTSTAPATLATQMNQAPAVPAMPAVQKNALAPMPVTSHATPVQPTKIQPCPHGTKMPDPGNLGTIDPDCPWTCVIVMHCHMHPQLFVVLNWHILYSQKGGCHMIAFSFKNCFPLHHSISLHFAVHIYWFPTSHSTCCLDLRELGCRYVQC